MGRLAEVAGWTTATRDDAAVVASLHRDKVVDAVHAIDEVAFFDEFFQYLRERGLWPHLEALDPNTRKGPLYPFIQFVLMTIMRCVGGVQSMLAMHDVLLTDEAMMARVGFNAHQVARGANRRGEERRKEPVEIRGALCYETIADAIVTIGRDELDRLFNAAIRALAAQGVFPKRIDAVLDTTDDEATPTYRTDGGAEVPSVRREKRPDVRANRRAQKVEVTVWGWKVWLVWEPVSKVPLAMKIDAINVADNEHALAVLRQARENVRGHATLRSVALDRGFLDGKLLHAIEGDGVLIYIPARADMHVTRDARAIARRALEAHARARAVDGVRVGSRDDEVTRGSGKKARTELVTTELVKIDAIDCDWWGPEGDSSKSYSKGFVPHRVGAVVVTRWGGAPKEEGRELVLLTTDPNADPFAAFDAYDDRSEIENSCNREAKESWWLERHPKRTEAGVRVQAYFVFLCMALVAGFRAHRSATDEAERQGQDTGMTRYRRELRASNRDRLLVVIAAQYAVLRSYEFALLAGVTVRQREPLGDTAESVLQRYGVPVGVDSS